MTTNRAIYVAVGLILLIVLGTTGYSLVSLSRFSDDAALELHTAEVLYSISDFLSTLQDAETGQRGSN